MKGKNEIYIIVWGGGGSIIEHNQGQKQQKMCLQEDD